MNCGKFLKGVLSLSHSQNCRTGGAENVVSESDGMPEKRRGEPSTVMQGRCHSLYGSFQTYKSQGRQHLILLPCTEFF